MEEVDSIGSSEFWFQMRVRDPLGTVVQPVRHQAGVDRATNTLYDCTTAYFTTSQFAPACPPAP